MARINTNNRKYQKYIRNFFKQSTVHGLSILGFEKIHIFERLLWIIVIMTSTLAAIGIGYSNYKRYLANPTVVSIQKDFRSWENPFPAVTGCFVNKVDQNKATKYIYDKWNINSSHHLFEYYMRFIKVVANTTYFNLHEFKPYVNDEKLKNVDLLEIAATVHPELSGTLVTFDSQHKTDWKLMLSEMGICFSVNSKFTDLLSFKTKDISNDNDTTIILRCHYLNGLCYGRYDSDPSLPIKYYTHSYLDVVHATSEPPLILKESEELEINYRMQETMSSKNLRSLSPSQRKCRFDDEPLTKDMPVFSTSMCYIGCRYYLVKKLCGCKPFFYHFLDGKVCGISGMVCLSQYSNNITISPQKMGCKCPQPCDIITYIPSKPKYTKWEYGYFDQRITFRWGLLPPTTKFHRDILFGFEELLVSFGGILALFLGVSVISMVEIVFLLVENVYFYFSNQEIDASKKDKKKTIINVRSIN